MIYFSIFKLLLFLLHIRSCNEQLWGIELQMWMCYKKFLVKMLQLWLWSNLVAMTVGSKKASNVLIMDKQKQQRQWPTGEQKIQKQSELQKKLNKKNLEPTCKVCRLLNIKVCMYTYKHKYTYAKICISKRSQGTTMLPLLFSKENSYMLHCPNSTEQLKMFVGAFMRKRSKCLLKKLMQHLLEYCTASFIPSWLWVLSANETPARGPSDASAAATH